MVVRIRRGLDLRTEGAPRQSVSDGPAIGTVAVLGSDYPGRRLEVLVEPEAQVLAGQPLLRDRKSRERVIVAPVSGRVSAVTRGPRRSIGAVEIAPEGDDRRAFALPASLDRDTLVPLLLDSGLWAAIRARPFGRPANLSTPVEALFITAMDTRPHAADPLVVIAQHAGWFDRGAAALTRLGAGKTYLCHAAGADLRPPAGVTAAAFAGPHPAGLPGTHIHHLFPVGRAGRIVWQVGYQDVLALGHLLETGRLWTDRIVAVGGPSVSSPGLLRTRPGANLRQLTQGRLQTDAVQLYSGSVLDGSVQDYLAREHLQVSVVPHRAAHGTPGRPLHVLHNWMRAGIPPIIPNAAHERVAPIGVLPIPFLRALSVGDVDMARRLGALELIEEDMALLSHVDGSGTDFGAMLRAVLDEIEELQ